MMELQQYYYKLILSLLLLLSTSFSSLVSAYGGEDDNDNTASKTTTPFDYSDALDKSLLFFEAQRSGYLPWNQRVKWRRSSGLKDGYSEKVDLVGGYYDAGDNVKFGLPMAYSMTLLSWAAIDFKQEILEANQMDNTLQAIKWGTDYFIKAHSQPNLLWVQVGDGESDHSCWERPEDMSTPRTSFKIDSSNPGSDVVGETSAALASASLVFKSYNSSYSNLLLHHAKKLFSFADNYRGEYDYSVTDAKSFYPSSGYSDELLWAAAWLYRATGNDYYLQYTVYKGVEFGGIGNAVRIFSWDNKYAGIQILLSKVLFDGKGGESKYTSTLQQYKAKADFYACAYLQKNADYNVPFTPGGLAYVLASNNMQYSASAAFLLSIYSTYLTSSNTKLTCPDDQTPINPKHLLTFSKQQADYILGKNPMSISYLVGFGKKYPVQVHHRGASIPSVYALSEKVKCVEGLEVWYKRKEPNPNVIVGALVGGPDNGDEYIDERENYEQNEPTTATSAPLIGLFAKMNSLYPRNIRGGKSANDEDVDSPPSKGGDSSTPSMFEEEVKPPAAGTTPPSKPEEPADASPPPTNTGGSSPFNETWVSALTPNESPSPSPTPSPEEFYYMDALKSDGQLSRDFTFNTTIFRSVILLLTTLLISGLHLL